MTFYVGQKVVCVNDGDLSDDRRGYIWFDDERIFTGRTYTVRRLFDGRFGPTLWLDEVRRSKRSVEIWGADVGYAPERFRPVVERKTDISIFQRMLTKQPENV